VEGNKFSFSATEGKEGQKGIQVNSGEKRVGGEGANINCLYLVGKKRARDNGIWRVGQLKKAVFLGEVFTLENSRGGGVWKGGEGDGSG